MKYKFRKNVVGFCYLNFVLTRQALELDQTLMLEEYRSAYKLSHILFAQLLINMKVALVLLLSVAMVSWL